MAKSYTEKKSSFLQAQKVFVDVGSSYINNWTKEELKRYRTEPVVIPLGNYGFLIVNLKISGIHADCCRVEQLDGEHIHDFTSKITAILFCLLNTKNKLDSANQLLKLDDKIGRLDVDLKNYECIMRKTQDSFKYSNLLNRSINAKIQRRGLIKLLQKTLKSAKYLNFGN